nr:hypothetical protein [Pyrinomonadaceae bacterium]
MRLDEKQLDEKRPATRALWLAASPLVLLLVVQIFFSPRGAQSSIVPPPANGEPRALIKSIVVGGVDRLEASAAEVSVIRAATSATEAARAGTLLYAQDEVKTGGNAQAILLFLDDPVVRDNEVLLDANTRVQISSVFARAGKILAKVKGFFKTKTTKIQLGVVGTEYELIVSPDGSATMTVIDGEVEVMKGNFSPLETGREPIDRWEGDRETNFVRAVFPTATPTATPPLYEEFTVNAGQVKLIEGQYTLKNRCQQRHLFQIQSPPNLPWLQLPGGDRLEISAGQERTINFAIRIDATNVPIGVYRGEIKAPCLDCDREPGCTLGGLFLRVEIKVVAPNGGQDGGQVTTTVKARKLETVTLAPDDESLSKSGAMAERVDSALRWTNNVILAAQPTYPARAIIPRFASPEDRSRAFSDARRKAVLSDDPDSQQTLGDVYLDWGEGARALDAYEKSSQSAPARQTSPELLTGKGEALRLTGRLEEAKAKLKQAIDSNQQWVPAWNALGNVYLDQANVARDKKDTTSARGYLAQAREAYMAAAQSPQ